MVVVDVDHRPTVAGWSAAAGGQQRLLAIVPPSLGRVLRPDKPSFDQVLKLRADTVRFLSVLRVLVCPRTILTLVVPRFARVCGPWRVLFRPCT